MTLNVGSLMATVDLDRNPFRRGMAGWRAEARAGARQVGADLDAETRRQEAMLGRAGERGGAAFGEGFTRDAEGRLRDAHGRFVRQGEQAGDGYGGGFRRGLKLSLGDGDSGGGFVRKILDSYKSVFQVSAKSAATAFSAQFVGSVVAGLASGAAKIAHGAAAMLALLPAVALTGGLALGALKLAVSGVGDALKAAATGSAEDFHTAVQNLSPAARAFALEVRHLKGDLTGLRQTVQDRFFAQFEGQTSRLAKTWLPILRRELGAVSEGFGDSVDSFAGWARQPAVVLTLTMALRNARGALANVLAAGENLPKIFLPLIAVGSTFLPRITRGLDDITTRWALWMQQAADTGRLADFIQGGLDKLRSLADTAGQLWRIGGNVVAVFREFGSLDSVFAALGIHTGGLLDQIEQLTMKARAFFSSEAGGQAITQIFSILRSTLSATMGTLAHLAVILGRTFGPILPQLSKFAEAVATIQLALADALEPALAAVANVLGDILPPLTSLLNLMAENDTVMASLAGTLIGLYTAWKLFSAATALAKMNLTAIKLTTAGVIAGIGALSMALIQIDQANHAKQLDNLVEGFLALDGAANQQARSMIYAAQVTGNLDEVMRGIIDANPRVAQSMLDNADALGITTEQQAEYQAQLDQTVAAQNNQVDALHRQKNAMRELTDPVFAAVEAQKRLQEAQQHVIDVQNDENATAADVAQAHQDVVEAAAANEAAQYDLAAAIENGETSLEAFLAKQKDQVKAGAITRADYNATAFTAAAAFGATRRSIEAVPRSHSTSLTARDYASAVAEKVAAKLRWLNGQTATVNIVGNVSGAYAGALLSGGRAHGGPVRAGGMYEVLERNEDELLHSGGRTYLMAARDGYVSPLGGGAAAMAGAGAPGEVRVIIEGTGILRGLQHECRVQAGGSAQVLLGT